MKEIGKVLHIVRTVWASKCYTRTTINPMWSFKIYGGILFVTKRISLTFLAHLTSVNYMKCWMKLYDSDKTVWLTKVFWISNFFKNLPKSYLKNNYIVWFQAFQEFVETFQEGPSKTSKVWVKAGTYDAGRRRKFLS